MYANGILNKGSASILPITINNFCLILTTAHTIIKVKPNQKVKTFEEIYFFH